MCFRNSAGWQTKETLRINHVMPEHPSILSYTNDHVVFTRYQCLHQCKATKYAFHFFESQLTFVWYGEHFHSHAMAVSAQHPHVNLSPEAQVILDEQLLKYPKNTVYHKIQGAATLAGLTAEAKASLPSGHYLDNRRAALLNAAKTFDRARMFEYHT
jgi:hypothetical protein